MYFSVAYPSARTSICLGNTPIITSLLPSPALRFLSLTGPSFYAALRNVVSELCKEFLMLMGVVTSEGGMAGWKEASTSYRQSFHICSSNVALLPQPSQPSPSFTRAPHLPTAPFSRGD